MVNTSRPSRISVAYVYFKRAIRWRRNNWPYISGDCFADLADYVYKSPRFRQSKGTLSAAEVIYCRSHDLQDLFDSHSNEIKAKVIITGNSDFEFHVAPSNIPESVKALFLQNSFITDNHRFFTVPIGVENFRLGVNGNPKHFKSRKSIDQLDPRILIGPLSPTHPTRSQVNRVFPVSSEIVEVLMERLKPGSYDKVSKKFVGVASVRGNGVDTHRLWESLYRGIVPIVKKDKWWDSLSDLYPQVAVIDYWSESEIADVLSTRADWVVRPDEIEALWMPYWKRQIEKHLD